MKIFCPKCHAVIDTEADPEYAGNEPDFAFCHICEHIVALKIDEYQKADASTPTTVRKKELKPVLLPTGHLLEVVGESNYQEALKGLAGGRKREEGVEIHTTATLVPEPSNPYDPNAIKVQIDGKLVGYIPRQVAKVLQPIIQKLAEHGEIGACSAIIKGGWYRSKIDQGHFGVVLNLAEPNKLKL